MSSGRRFWAVQHGKKPADSPPWLRFIYTVALGQVLLGAVVWLLLATGPQ
jgi:hypothetical protein